VRYSVSTHFRKALLKIEAHSEKYSPADGDVVDMKAKNLVDLLLGIFSKDPVSHIKDGNTPQLVIKVIIRA
jgi:hypothetical protein